MILLKKSVYSIAIKEKCLISIFMTINEKHKEETKLISVYGLACDIHIFVTYFQKYITEALWLEGPP